MLANESIAILELTDAVPALADALLDLAETLELGGKSGQPAIERALELFETKGNVVMVAGHSASRRPPERRLAIDLGHTS